MPGATKDVARLSPFVRERLNVLENYTFGQCHRRPITLRHARKCCPMTAVWSMARLPQEDLAGLLGTLDPGLYCRPMPAVLDTDCVRTGLHAQLGKREPPASVWAAQSGMTRLFMEYDTFTEAIARLPRFAGQFGVPVAELQRMMDEDWLPYIHVVQLPEELRQLDSRAAAVKAADPNDYAAASLAALLSPCIVLTRDRHHFAALGVRSASQGVDGVLAAIQIEDGELRVQMALTVPAIPVRLAAAGFRQASERIGPVAAGVILLVAAAGGSGGTASSRKNGASRSRALRPPSASTTWRSTPSPQVRSSRPGPP